MSKGYTYHISLNAFLLCSSGQSSFSWCPIMSAPRRQSLWVGVSETSRGRDWGRSHSVSSIHLRASIFLARHKQSLLRRRHC